MKTIINPPIQDIAAPQNLERAWKQVKRNNGSAGVDGISAKDMPLPNDPHWVEVAEQIRTNQYSPEPTLRVEIPKGDGTKRGLNVPTVTDRVVQASVANYITWMFDEDMSDESYGFRPERCCEQAVVKCLEFINDGYEWVVDLDLRKFFDTVDQDRLVRLVDNLFHDSTLTSLIRKFLTAGVVVDGKLTKTTRGIPQGGPLSPVLANIYLNQADQELERRGLRYARYADDMVILVKSEKAADRVMKSVTRYLEGKLKLEVNATKSKIARPNEVKFLGFSFAKQKEGGWKAVPHEKSFKRLEAKIDELTKRNWGVSTEYRIQKINDAIRGWFDYFRCAWISKSYLRKLGGKIRNRLRMIIWKLWKKPGKRFIALVRMGCPRREAYMLANTRRGYARCAATFLKTFITNDRLKRKGLILIEEYYPLCQSRFHRVFTRTARCRTACRVV